MHAFEELKASLNDMGTAVRRFHGTSQLPNCSFGTKQYSPHALKWVAEFATFAENLLIFRIPSKGLVPPLGMVCFDMGKERVLLATVVRVTTTIVNRNVFVRRVLDKRGAGGACFYVLLFGAKPLRHEKDSCHLNSVPLLDTIVWKVRKVSTVQSIPPIGVFVHLQYMYTRCVNMCANSLVYWLTIMNPPLN